MHVAGTALVRVSKHIYTSSFVGQSKAEWKNIRIRRWHSPSINTWLKREIYLRSFFKTRVNKMSLTANVLFRLKMLCCPGFFNGPKIANGDLATKATSFVGVVLPGGGTPPQMMKVRLTSCMRKKLVCRSTWRCVQPAVVLIRIT